MPRKNSQVPEKNKNVRKYEDVGSKGRTSKASMKALNSTVENKDSLLSTINRTPDVAVAATRMSSSTKKNNNNKDSLKSDDQEQKPLTKSSSIALTSQTCTTFVSSSVRGVNSRAGNVAHESSAKVNKDYPVKKFSNEVDTKLSNYQIQKDYKETAAVVTNQDYKSRSGNAITNLPTRFSNQTSTQALHRENPMTSNVHSRPVSRNDNTAFAVAKKALEQQQKNPVKKISQIIFPPLRAPQSIVNVRHPSVTEAKIKHNEISGPSTKSKLTISSSLQSGSMKELERNRKTYHNYGTSQIAGITNVQNLSNVTANISAYTRPPDSFPQPTVASVLLPETAQFPQSPPFSTTQIGQLNQYQTYDPGSFATTSVNVNPVIPQFSAESSIPYSQYENPPQFVQTNYPAADMASSQYQYQTPGVGQIQDSPMFIQSLQSPITVTEQYAAAPNYTRTVRAELMPRLRRPTKFNK